MEGASSDKVKLPLSRAQDLTNEISWDNATRVQTFINLIDSNINGSSNMKLIYPASICVYYTYVLKILE